ncbi:hypothetical protein [Variovorax sp. J31P207]|uniref:hypothetical protein n=1 Tax=Variovorax sp. J31P207 TaxID=3053510 RepID=UPI002577DCB9|nr:hypothetical protein [Variovorax sp. J31P207]MDM0068526.1 hypothetical protein [Variovorax sp. J31P207]
MNIIWSSIAIVLLALAGGVAVAGGEPAMAELRLAEAATMAAAAGVAAVCIREAAQSVSAVHTGAPID